MQTNKKTMLAAALVVAVVALAGVGYAVSHTAETTNTDNTLTAQSTVVTQDGDGRYDVASWTTDITFHSITEGVTTGSGQSASTEVTTKYTPVYTHKIDGTSVTTGEGVTGLNYALASTVLSLTFTPSNETQGTFNLDVVATSGFTPTPGLEYILVIAPSGTTVASASYTATKVSTDYDNGWSFTGLNFGTATAAGLATAVTYTVFLFVGVDETAPTGASIASGIDDATFKFTATIA